MEEERGVGGRKKQNNKHNNYNPRCEIILAAKSSSGEFPDKLRTSNNKVSMLLDK